jgi:3',5'-cyclic AMP phosphodiesterase CpdA
MRIAHITDIHVTRIPRLRQMTPKRLLGTANLLLGGRRHHFSVEVQEAMVEGVKALEPDAIICTGDLTQTAIPEEFEGAKELLSPLFSRYPTVLISGNHDAYTQQAWKNRDMEGYFDGFMGDGPWPRVHHLNDNIAVLCIDTCRAHILSSGQIADAELVRLRELLIGDALRGKKILVALHYPLRDRHGAPYGPPSRALVNAAELEAVLLPHAHRITAVLHGHEHHGYQTTLGNSSSPEASGITILNPGSSGYAWLPRKGRTAHFNLYTMSDDQLSVERFAYCGKAKRFLPEKGGAYASGG